VIVLLDAQPTAPICCDSSSALDPVQTAQTKSDMAASVLWQFLEAWREDPELGSIPVVVDTAFPDVQVEGAAVLLRKPFDLTTLLTTISRLCDGDREISTQSNSTS